MISSHDFGAILGLLILTGLACAPVQAQPPRGDGERGRMEHHMRHHGPNASRHDAGRHGDHDGRGRWARAWKRTLTDEQRAQVDGMHLDLVRKRSPLEARRRLARLELGLLATHDTPDMDAMNAKIDEILKLQRELMKARVAHIAEVRTVLTAEQRVSFDMGVLERMKRMRRGRH